MGIEIVTYADSHFEGVDALWRESSPDASPRNTAKIAIPAKLAYQPDLFLVAMDGARVVGSTMAGYDGHRGWIYAVAVLAAYRSRGIGTRLMAEAEARLAAMGCIKINLQVVTANAAVIAFYRRLGYAVEERISLGKVIQPL
jgi:ribosomal protein S18 acetylase RimI-like enzyme